MAKRILMHFILMVFCWSFQGLAASVFHPASNGLFLDGANLSLRCQDLLGSSQQYGEKIEIFSLIPTAVHSRPIESCESGICTFATHVSRLEQESGVELSVGFAVLAARLNAFLSIIYSRQDASYFRPGTSDYDSPLLINALVNVGMIPNSTWTPKIPIRDWDNLFLKVAPLLKERIHFWQLKVNEMGITTVDNSVLGKPEVRDLTRQMTDDYYTVYGGLLGPIPRVVNWKNRTMTPQEFAWPVIKAGGLDVEVKLPAWPNLASQLRERDGVWTMAEANRSQDGSDTVSFEQLFQEIMKQLKAGHSVPITLFLPSGRYDRLDREDPLKLSDFINGEYYSHETLIVGYTSVAGKITGFVRQEQTNIPDQKLRKISLERFKQLLTSATFFDKFEK